MTTNHCNVSRR